MDDELAYLRKLSETDAAQIFSLHQLTMATRHELEYSRRAFSLVADLFVIAARPDIDYHTVLVDGAKKITIALNMSRVLILEALPTIAPAYLPVLAHGYAPNDAQNISELSIALPDEIINASGATVVTGADTPEHFASLRGALQLPFFIVCPITVFDEPPRFLIAGRMIEAPPFMTRLSEYDVRSLTVVAAFLGSLLTTRRLSIAEKRNREMYEELQKSIAVKEQFLANLSHELFTPLNAINGMHRELSNSSKNNQSLHSIVAKAQSGTKQLGVLLKQALDYAALRRHRQESSLKIRSFSPRKVLSNLLATANKKNPNLKFSAQYAADIPLKLRGAYHEFTQAALNLLHYAVRAANGVTGGEIAVSLVRLSTASGRARLWLRIDNNGGGVPETETENCFGAFSAADNSLTRTKNGFGLNLALAKENAKLLDAEIWREPAENSRDRFCLLADFDLAELEISIADDWSALAGLKVLLAEDNEINQEITTAALKEINIEPTIANNGAIALTKAARAAFDFILMDIQMPEMDGLTAAKLIRENPKYARIPIIALTAHCSLNDCRRSLQAGMNDHLTKPFDPVPLYATIKKWCHETALQK